MNTKLVNDAVKLRCQMDAMNKKLILLLRRMTNEEGREYSKRVK